MEEASDEDDCAADEASEEDADVSCDEMLVADDVSCMLFCAAVVENGAFLHAVMVTTAISEINATDKMTLSLLMALITPFLLFRVFSVSSFL